MIREGGGSILILLFRVGGGGTSSGCLGWGGPVVATTRGAQDIY